MPAEEQTAAHDEGRDMRTATATPLERPREAQRPTLTVLPGGKGPTSAATYRRRRTVVALGFLCLVAGLTLLFGSGGAEAELTDRVAGHEVVEPGETLWDVATATAPPGVDVREQLGAILELNGFTTGDVPAWTVVAIPAR